MIVCPNCSHSNPDGATQCEACLTPLPTTTQCPNCGAPIQTDAGFCGQCGFNLQGNTATMVPDPLPSNEIEEAQPLTEATVASNYGLELSKPPVTPPPAPVTPAPATVAVEVGTPASIPPTVSAATQLQVPQATLLHVQTNTVIELPSNLTVIHIGKPGGAIPPDIDVSGFPDSAVVSRVHANLRVEEGIYFVEDVGSANGTYINHNPLAPGNRHRLRAGDRIALGKEDKVTFILQSV